MLTTPKCIRNKQYEEQPVKSLQKWGGVRRDWKRRGWHKERNETGKTIPVFWWLHSESELAMLISHTRQKVVVVSNKSDSNSFSKRRWFVNTVRLLKRSNLYWLSQTKNNLPRIWPYSFSFSAGTHLILIFEKAFWYVRKHFLLTLFSLWFFSLNAARVVQRSICCWKGM